MTSEWPWTLNCRKYPVYTEYLLPGPKFSSVSLHDQPLARYKVVKRSEMHWMTQNDLEHLTVKCTLYTLHNYPRGRNSHPFCSTTSRFRDSRLSERKWTKWPQADLEHVTVKSILYALNTYPWDPHFHPFCGTTSHFQDTGLQKIGNTRNDIRTALNN